MFGQPPSGKRRSRVGIATGGGARGFILPSQLGCTLGPEAEACAEGRTTITREQYLAGPNRKKKPVPA